MSVTLDQILPEYMKWLTEEGIVSLASAKSYRGYVRKSFELIETITDIPFTSASLWKEKAGNNKYRKIIPEISSAVLNKAKKDPNIPTKAKTISNWMSGLYHFWEFCKKKHAFSVDDIKEYERQITETFTKYKDFEITYTHSDIMRIFDSRIHTQNRVYAEILFPASYMKAIMKGNHEKDYKKLYEDKLNGTKFYIDDKGSFKTLREIKEIIICPAKSEAYCLINGTRYLLYTQSPDKSFKKLEVDDISQISIDHIEPLYNLLCGTDKYKTYKTVSKEILKFFNMNPDISDYKTYKDLNRRMKRNSANFAVGLDNTLKENFYNETCTLYGEMEFAAMLGSDNSSKSKN